MRRRLAVLTCCLLSASWPSSALAQFVRSARPSPVVNAAPGAVRIAGPSAPGLLPSLAAPSLHPVLPSLPTPAASTPHPSTAFRAERAAASPEAAVLPAASAVLPAAAAVPASAAAAPAAQDERTESAQGRLQSLYAAKDVEPLWTGGAPRRGAGGVWAGRGPSPIPGARAGLARPRAPASAALDALPADAPVVIPAQTLRRRAADGLHYLKVTGSSLWWYTFPRLVERWDEVVQGLEGGNPRAVRRIMGFFIAHRVLGSTGSYAPMGFRVAANRTVILDAWRIYIRYFRGDTGSAEAFARLVARATVYNPNRRSTQFRKVIFHALREAAVMSPDRVPGYFESLLTSEKSAALAAYQESRQAAVLERFDAVTRAVILELNAGLPRGRRVVGAVLLGSFANGAAGPGSDLDVQTLSEDGGTFYNAEFLGRLKARWKAEGDPTHPVSGFEYALPLSKTLLQKIHREAYLVVSPYREVVAAMSTAPEDLHSRGAVRTKGGLAFVVFYSAVLFVVLSAYEAWRLAKKAVGA